MKRKIKVAIADDDVVFRSILISHLETNPNIHVTSSVSNGKNLIKELSNEKPDIVLLDLIMPIMDGASTTKYLQERHPDIKIIILTAHSDVKTSSDLIVFGAHSFLKKEKDLNEVIDTIRLTMEGHSVFKNWSIRDILLSYLPKKEPVSINDLILSEIELQIIDLICREFSNKEISDTLHMTVKNVEYHKSKLLKKTSSETSVGLSLYAVKNGLFKNRWD